jgi:hypothetical protein
MDKTARWPVIYDERKALAALRATGAEGPHGTGPEVARPLLSLVMAMTGRKAVLADLSGDGVALLTQRA